MNSKNKEALYLKVNRMLDLLESGELRYVHHVRDMLEGLRKEIQDGVYDE
tara:strand:- start:367 stop:516 length:150 start_codon:yes stop_codon:yes gene_type:complete